MREVDEVNALGRCAVAAGVVAALSMAASCDTAEERPEPVLSLQKDILRVRQYERIVPANDKLIDWRGKALAFDRLVFDADAEGKFLPLIWRDDTYDTFGMPAYVGDPRSGRDGAQEAVTTIAAVLSASLLGLDKSEGADFVGQLDAFYSEREHIILNNPAGGSATTSMWYLLYPTLLFAHVSDLYGDHAELRAHLLTTIESWYRAYEIMSGGERPDFDYTGFDFVAMEPYRNGVWTEPDSAAGIGMLMYYGYRLTGDEKYLAASIRCMEYIESYFGSPLYEALLYFAPALAAKLNALHGTSFEMGGMFDDTLTSTAIPRGGWGTLVGDWNGYGVNGLMGSTTDGGGYAFAMNTFASAGAIVPAVRYDARFARDVGVWMLNLASHARYFFAGETDAANQSCTYVDACDGIDERIREAVPYEGIRKASRGRSPWFGGDPTVYGWAQTDFSLYSGAHIGVLASIVEPTNVNGILRLDLSTTRFFSERDFPAFLLYNPHPGERRVKYAVASDEPADLFDTVTNTVVARGVSGSFDLRIPGGEAVVVIELPAGAAIEKRDEAYVADGIWLSRDWSALHIVGPERNAAVSEPFRLDVRLATSGEEVGIDRTTVEIDGREIHFRKDEPVVIRPEEFTKGTKRIVVTVVTEDGAVDRGSIRLRFE